LTGYFNLSATPEKTVTRTVQVLAIILADIMTVRGYRFYALTCV
jgi:hypothetical protein